MKEYNPEHIRDVIGRLMNKMDKENENIKEWEPKEETPKSITVPGYGKMKVSGVEILDNGKKMYSCMARIKSESVPIEVFAWPSGFEVYHRDSTVPYLVCDDNKVVEHYMSLRRT